MFLPEHPPLLLQRWIFQRQRRPWLYSFANQNLVAAFPADFHVHFPVFRTLLCVHNGAPRFSKQRSRRNHNSVRNSRHRNAYLGDGTRIDDADLAAIRAAYDAELLKFPWQPGDLLMVDNLAMAHGRSSFAGPRKLLVAMTGSVGGH